MADPITLAVVGATAGAMLNRNDPVKGALVGGTLGYGGATMAGIGATQAAAPIANATYAAGAPQIAGLTAGQAGATAGSAAVPSAFGQAMNTAMGSSPGTVPMGSFGNVGMRTGGFGNTIGTASSPTSLMGMASPFSQEAAAEAVAAGQKPAGLLGGDRGQQLLVANQLLGRNQQAAQRMPMAPAIQSRPYTGMKNPVMSDEERMKQMMAMYSMPQRQPIRLI